MRERGYERGYDDDRDNGWDDPRLARGYDTAESYGADIYADEDDGGYADPAGYGAPEGVDAGEEGDERGLVLSQDESLVGVSSIVTQHGTPILSYTRTMNRFYTTRKQRLSLGRHRCEVCGERIRFWSFETPTGSHTHDGCYERMAWMWTNVYAQQQRLASEGRLDS